MKNNILIIIIAGIISVSASVAINKVISVPATPIATETFITDGSSTLLDMKEFIITRQRAGFIVKSVSFGVGSRSAGGIVVVEKYK